MTAVHWPTGLGPGPNKANEAAQSNAVWVQYFDIRYPYKRRVYWLGWIIDFLSLKLMTLTKLTSN